MGFKPKSLKIALSILLLLRRKGEKMGTCKCGCGESVNVSDFLPGHDQRLRTQIEHQVGGLLVLKDLVLAAKKYAWGETGAEEFENLVRRIFAAKDQK